MKQAKQRVIAIDYFRGICLLLVLVNHSVLFSMPYALWAGAGGLWTSAAEMFLLLSGITYGVVRSHQISDAFKTVLRKTWRRAAIIYAANIIVVLTSLLLGLLLTAHNLTSDVNGQLSNYSPLRLITEILTFHYSVGWADFLMYFSAFLIFAPFLLYILKTRYWPLIPALSLAIFSVHYYRPILPGIYDTFLMWQVYFILGLVIGRFRPQLLSATNVLTSRYRKIAGYIVISLASLTLVLSYLLEHSIYSAVSRLTAEGWLPVKLQLGYLHLLNLRPGIDKYLLDGRNGLARPFVSLLVAASVYIIYRRYGTWLLDKSGSFFLALGRDSLWVFVGQAIAIPLIAALPIPHNSWHNNLALTSLLIFLMWLLTRRQLLISRLRGYGGELREAFYEAKQMALYRQPDE